MKRLSKLLSNKPEYPACLLPGETFEEYAKRVSEFYRDMKLYNTYLMRNRKQHGTTKLRLQ